MLFDSFTQPWHFFFAELEPGDGLLGESLQSELCQQEMRAESAVQLALLPMSPTVWRREDWVFEQQQLRRLHELATECEKSLQSPYENVCTTLFIPLKCTCSSLGVFTSGVPWESRSATRNSHDHHTLFRRSWTFRLF